MANQIQETPIQRILRENNERKVNASSEENIKIIARRLHNLCNLKAVHGFTQKINGKDYRKKQEQNQFKKTQKKVNNLTGLAAMIRRTTNNALGC